MKRSVVLAALMLMCAAAPVPAQGQEKVLLCGTGDSQDLLRAVGAAFEKTHPGTAIVVPDSVGSDGGITAASSGQCDFGRVARPLKDQEKELKLTYKAFAFSPVVLLVDPASGVENLGSRQIVDIYAGRVTTWSEVGGRGGKISVVSREAKDSSRGVLNRHVEGFKSVETPVGTIANKTPEAVDLLGKTPSVIGYLPAAMAKGLKLKIVKVNGTAPSAVNVANGTYSLALPFALVWKGQPKPAAAQFLQFLKGAEARAIIIEHGVVPAELL